MSSSKFSVKMNFSSKPSISHFCVMSHPSLLFTKLSAVSLLLVTTSCEPNSLQHSYFRFSSQQVVSKRAMQPNNSRLKSASNVKFRRHTARDNAYQNKLDYFTAPSDVYYKQSVSNLHPSLTGFECFPKNRFY